MLQGTSVIIYSADANNKKVLPEILCSALLSIAQIITRQCRYGTHKKSVLLKITWSGALFWNKQGLIKWFRNKQGMIKGCLNKTDLWNYSNLAKNQHIMTLAVNSNCTVVGNWRLEPVLNLNYRNSRTGPSTKNQKTHMLSRLAQIFTS